MSAQVGKDVKDLGELIWVADLVPLKLQLHGVKSRLWCHLHKGPCLLPSSSHASVSA